MKKKVSSIVLNLVLLVLGVVTVYPFLWMLASSLRKKKIKNLIICINTGTLSNMNENTKEIYH